MEASKLWNKEKDALIDAVAILETVFEARCQVQPGTIETMREMIGLKPKIEDHMNAAISEQYENERQAKKEKSERYADYSDQEK